MWYEFLMDSYDVFIYILHDCFTDTSPQHYGDVKMGAMASQITSITIVYSAIYSGANQRKKIKAPRDWPLCGKFTSDRWIPRTNGQWRGKCIHLMTSSWIKWSNADGYGLNRLVAHSATTTKQNTTQSYSYYMDYIISAVAGKMRELHKQEVTILCSAYSAVQL